MSEAKGGTPDGTGLDEEVVRGVLERVRGPVLRPGNPEYDVARAVRNGLIDRRPALIVRPTGTADVVEAVTFAREGGHLLSVRGGGHNVAGHAVCDGGIVIDLSGMRGVHVDPRARTVRVQGGATWGDVDRETQLFGLATTGGNVSTTGVGGLTLHGGMGHLRRKYGLSIDNLLSVEIVTADGQVRTASAAENPDLFWAMRGAGSNFGVVTSFEFRLFPVGPTVALCAPWYPLEDAPSLLPAWRDFMAGASDEISSVAILWSVPAAEPFPVEHHGRSALILAAVHAGPAEEGEAAMRPLRELRTPLLDMSGPISYTTLQAAFDPFFPEGGLYYWKSMFMDRLDEDAIEALCGFGETRPDPRSLIALWHQGGAMARTDPSETAFGGRHAPFLVSFDTCWSEPADSEGAIAWTRASWAAMRSFSDGSVYLNFAGFGEEKDALLRNSYGAENYARLAALKAKYDPTNLFRMNQNIEPALVAG